MTPYRSPPRPLDVAAIVGLLLSLAWFWPARVATPVSRYTFSSWDLFLYFAPMYDYVGAALREARVPLWNPHQGCGEPLLGVLQAGVFYPARALLVFLDTPRAMACSAAMHVGIALLAMFLYGRSIGMSAWAAAIAALTLAYGVIASMLYQPATFLEPGVWLPLAAFALQRLVATGRWRWVVLTATATAAPILAGGYQIAVYSAYGIVAVCLGLWLDPATRKAAARPRMVALFALCALLAVALAAPQWVTTLLWAGETLRPAHALDASRVDPFLAPPLVVLETLLGRRDVLNGIFLPPAIAALAVVGAVAGPRLTLPLVVLTIVSLGLSLGPTTPWFDLYYWLPGFAIFRTPSRLHYLVVFGAAVSAGFGLDVLRRRAVRRPWFANAVVAAAVAATLVTYQLTPAHNPAQRLTAALDRWDALSAGGMAAIGLLSPPLVGPAALLTSAASLWRTRKNDSVLPYSPAAETVARHAATYQTLAERREHWRAVFAAPAVHWLMPGFTAKNAMLHGFDTLDDYEPLASARLVHYVAMLTAGSTDPATEMRVLSNVIVDEPFAKPRLLDVASVRFIVAPADRIGAIVGRAGVPYRSRYDLVAWMDRRRITIFENPSAVPRAYLVPTVTRAEDDDTALRAIADDRFEAGRTAVAVDAPPLPAASDADVSGDAAAIVSYAPERVRIATSASGPRALVLTDAFAPGWMATVDGHDVPIWRANYLFRGVTLPPGSHEVIFTYAAPGYRAGVIAAACAVLVLAGVPLATRSRAGVAAHGDAAAPGTRSRDATPAA